MYLWCYFLAGSSLPPPAAYGMTQEEKLRYDTLFASYDTDSDGSVNLFLLLCQCVVLSDVSFFLYSHWICFLHCIISFLQGGEAVAVFNQAGLDLQVLRSIWALADDDKDGKLSALEFAVAFHIIICVR